MGKAHFKRYVGLVLFAVDLWRRRVFPGNDNPLASTRCVGAGGKVSVDLDHPLQQQPIKRKLEKCDELDMLLVMISTRFISLTSDQIDCEINDALQEIGEFIGADRSYIFLCSADGTKMDNTHEWCAAGIEPQIQYLQGIAFNQELPWFAEKIQGFEAVYVPSVADLPLEASNEKAHFDIQGIQSLIGVPMILGGRLMGYVGFDAVRVKKAWSETSLVVLKIVGDIMVNALERQRAESQMQYRLLLEGTLATVSRSLILGADIDLEQHVLQPFGAAVKANRAYIFLLQENGHRIDNTHEWCSPGTEPQIAHLQNLDTTLFAWSISQLQRGENLVIPNVLNLPTEAAVEKQSFQARQICSLLAVPIYSPTGAFMGLMGFDDTQQCRTWSKEDIQILRVGGEMISHYLARKQAESDLERLNTDLEQANQTLAKTNFNLETTIEIRTTELRESEARFRRIVESNMIGILFTDLNGAIQDMNDAFLRITGYTRKDLLITSTNWRDITPTQYHPILKTAITQLKQSGVSTPWEQECIHKDGSYVPVILGGALLRQTGDDAVCFVLDISERKQAEEQVKAALREKEVLLSEVHHRVMNNLQVIVSLLRLQSQRIQDPSALKAFEQSQTRIMVMSLIHQRLYESKNFAQIDFSQYIRHLVAELSHAYRLNPSLIAFRIDVGLVFLGIDTAVPCALIINELVTNAVKHAFPEGQMGEIAIALNKAPHSPLHVLVVQDNGVGLPQEINWQKPQTFGLDLVRILTRQLQGELLVDCHSGTTFTITFP